MRIVARGLVLLFVLLSVTVSAKNNSGAEKRANLITSWMEKKLDLSVEQTAQIEVLNLKYENEIEKLTTEKNGFICMQAVRDSLQRKEMEMKDVLSEEQLASYIECKCELKEELKRKCKMVN
ncbi:hypothetical protein BZG02_16735 [Labilibaculum filiforme]|uniref:Uncharacterized protein n=1 Tax=Labilibaculum filiforme TaxID=1940526 RepID=A0A2N3HSS4_9BACT|nr:hypothetical protein [Labilibaculum filiforme]PKQ61093.1 hypothetical protein BZG02_16735 [Labilibaculum filiforme]